MPAGNAKRRVTGDQNGHDIQRQSALTKKLTFHGKVWFNEP